MPRRSGPSSITSSWSSVAEWVSSAARRRDRGRHLAAAGPAGEERDGGADALAPGRHEVAGGRLQRGLGVGGGPGELRLQRAELVEETGTCARAAWAFSGRAPRRAASSSCSRITLSFATDGAI